MVRKHGNNRYVFFSINIIEYIKNTTQQQKQAGGGGKPAGQANQQTWPAGKLASLASTAADQLTYRFPGFGPGNASDGVQRRAGEGKLESWKARKPESQKAGKPLESWKAGAMFFLFSTR